MIDEILDNELLHGHYMLRESGKTGKEFNDAKLELIAQALTAIYEIGLECIGAAKKLPKVDWDADQSYAEHAIKAQNQLIASQRKAWAKACGVAE